MQHCNGNTVYKRCNSVSKTLFTISGLRLYDQTGVINTLSGALFFRITQSAHLELSTGTQHTGRRPMFDIFLSVESYAWEGAHALRCPQKHVYIQSEGWIFYISVKPFVE